MPHPTLAMLKRQREIAKQMAHILSRCVRGISIAVVKDAH